MQPIRVAKGALLGIGAILVFGAAAISLSPLAVKIWAHWPFDWPSDRQVEALFRKHHSDFVELVEMVKSDNQMESIRMNWLRAKGQTSPSDYHWTPNSGISLDRWAEYKRRFSGIGLKHGLSVSENGMIQFHLAVIGTLIIAPGSYKDLIYKPEAIPWGRGTTIVSSLEDDKLPKVNGNVEVGFYVRRIEPNWYISRLETY
jgi:hypothetical protein